MTTVFAYYLLFVFIALTMGILTINFVKFMVHFIAEIAKGKRIL